MKPYGLIADVHLHGWSSFSHPTKDGVNSRLEALLDEIERAGQAVLGAGGNTLVVAGDLFHVRGSVAPSVLNPTLDTFQSLRGRGLDIRIIPGNHDLEGKNSDRLGSAVTSLESLGCKVSNKPRFCDGMGVVLVPWFDKVGELKEALIELSAPGTFLADDQERARVDLILHAPINGVLLGIPDHGLEPQWLANLGFRRVFAGHYHHHKSFCDGKVWSIGALAHHTWSDVGSAAGFCLVYPDRVEHVPSALPKFVDVRPEMSADEVTQAVKGNFARVKVDTAKLSEIEAMRKWLEKQGALGNVVISVRQPTAQRSGGVTASVSAGASIQASVSEYVKSLSFDKPERAALVDLEAQRVLAEAEVED